jgi:hypothetical protein
VVEKLQAKENFAADIEEENLILRQETANLRAELDQNGLLEEIHTSRRKNEMLREQLES